MKHTVYSSTTGGSSNECPATRLIKKFEQYQQRRKDFGIYLTDASSLLDRLYLNDPTLRALRLSVSLVTAKPSAANARRVDTAVEEAKILCDALRSLEEREAAAIAAEVQVANDALFIAREREEEKKQKKTGFFDFPSPLPTVLHPLQLQPFTSYTGGVAYRLQAAEEEEARQRLLKEAEEQAIASGGGGNGCSGSMSAEKKDESVPLPPIPSLPLPPPLLVSEALLFHEHLRSVEIGPEVLPVFCGRDILSSTSLSMNAGETSGTKGGGLAATNTRVDQESAQGKNYRSNTKKNGVSKIHHSTHMSNASGSVARGSSGNSGQWLSGEDLERPISGGSKHLLEDTENLSDRMVPSTLASSSTKGHQQPQQEECSSSSQEERHRYYRLYHWSRLMQSLYHLPLKALILPDLHLTPDELGHTLALVRHLTGVETVHRGSLTQQPVSSFPYSNSFCHPQKCVGQDRFSIQREKSSFSADPLKKTDEPKFSSHKDEKGSRTGGNNHINEKKLLFMDSGADNEGWRDTFDARPEPLHLTPSSPSRSSQVEGKAPSGIVIQTSGVEGIGKSEEAFGNEYGFSPKIGDALSFTNSSHQRQGTLKYLDLRHTTISPYLAEQLGRMLFHPNSSLVRVELEGCSIKDDGARALFSFFPFFAHQLQFTSPFFTHGRAGIRPVLSPPPYQLRVLGLQWNELTAATESTLLSILPTLPGEALGENLRGFTTTEGEQSHEYDPEGKRESVGGMEREVSRYCDSGEEDSGVGRGKGQQKVSIRGESGENSLIIPCPTSPSIGDGVDKDGCFRTVGNEENETGGPMEDEDMNLAYLFDNSLFIFLEGNYLSSKGNALWKRHAKLFQASQKYRRELEEEDREDGQGHPVAHEVAFTGLRQRARSTVLPILPPVPLAVLGEEALAASLKTERARLARWNKGEKAETTSSLIQCMLNGLEEQVRHLVSPQDVASRKKAWRRERRAARALASASAGKIGSTDDSNSPVLGSSGGGKDWRSSQMTSPPSSSYYPLMEPWYCLRALAKMVDHPSLGGSPYALVELSSTSGLNQKSS